MLCATAGCARTSSGKSKYCSEHKVVARQKWMEQVRAGDAAKKERDEKWALLWSQAHEAGMKAGDEVIPRPMIVQERANPLDDNSPVVREYAPIMDGVCGFAWVVVTPGNHSFALWCKKHKGASKHYYGGMQVKWVGEFNQSMTRKEAYARAFADVLRAEGIKAYAGSRMD